MQVKKVLTPLLIAISTLLISTSCDLVGKGKKKTDKESLRKHETGLSDIITKRDLGTIDTSDRSGKPSKSAKPLEETWFSDISLEKKHKTRLSDIITNPDLGTIDTADRSGTPSKKEVEHRLHELYPELILDGLDMIICGAFGMKKVYIFPGTSGYTDLAVILTYTISQERLKDIITNPDLGEINPCGRPLEEEIKNILQKRHGIEPEAILVHILCKGHATIIPDTDYGDYYLADPLDVILTYTIPKTNHSHHSDKTTFNPSQVDEARKTLGIPESTLYTEAKKIYNKLVLESHPDKKQQDLGRPLTAKEKEEYNAAFDKVKKAWIVISSTLARDAFSEYCAKKPNKSDKTKNSKIKSIFSRK